MEWPSVPTQGARESYNMLLWFRKVGEDWKIEIYICICLYFQKGTTGVTLALILTIAWMSKGRVLPFFLETLLLFWPVTCWSAPEIATPLGHPATPSSLHLQSILCSRSPCLSSHVPSLSTRGCPLHSPNPLWLLLQTRAMQKAETMTWIMISKTTYRHSGLPKRIP